MKKFIALSLTALSLSSVAATQAELRLKGVVAPILEISIDQETVASNLDLSKSADKVKVGTVTEKSNYSQGYKIKSKSKNNGKLVNGSDANSSVTYTLLYENSNVILNNTPSPIFTNNQRGTFTRDVKISYNQPINLSAGTYEDEVQFTIEAN